MEPSHQHDSKDIYFHQLSHDFDQLLNKEELLIRSEFQEKTRDIQLSKLSLYVCGVALIVGCLCVAGAMILVLGTYIEFWKAAFVVGLLFLSFAGFIYGGAREKSFHAGRPPERSLTALHEMKNSIHEKMNEITRH